MGTTSPNEKRFSAAFFFASKEIFEVLSGFFLWLAKLLAFLLVTAAVASSFTTTQRVSATLVCSFPDFYYKKTALQFNLFFCEALKEGVS